MSKDNRLPDELDSALKFGYGHKIAKLALICLGGMPEVGGVFNAVAGVWSEAEQEYFKKVLASWLKLQEAEIKVIGVTLVEVMNRVDTTDRKVRDRIESQEYLSLIKKCFRDWSAAESEQKRILIRNILSNAASSEKICGDDVIRMFIEWIDRYTEAQFSIIKIIYENPGITRYQIWQKIYGPTVREDSAEADLFRLFIHDLGLGRVIRQHREKDYSGNFIKTRQKKSTTNHMTSAFDDEKQYELTELGRWFVHYAMNKVVPKLENGKK